MATAWNERPWYDFIKVLNKFEARFEVKLSSADWVERRAFAMVIASPQYREVFKIAGNKLRLRDYPQDGLAGLDQTRAAMKALNTAADLCKVYGARCRHYEVKGVYPGFREWDFYSNKLFILGDFCRMVALDLRAWRHNWPTVKGR